MHRHGPLLGQFAEAQHLLEELFSPRQPGDIGKTSAVQGIIEQQRGEMLLFLKTVIDLLDSNLVSDDPDQVEPADEQGGLYIVTLLQTHCCPIV